MTELYLDHAATTPLRPAARAAMLACLDEGAGGRLGNPSAMHAAGRRAREAVEEARELVAEVLACSPHDVVFTSGGTEADNLAVKGLAWAAADRADRRHVVTSAVEHPAVREAAAWLSDHGFRWTEVAPEADGTVPVERVLDVVRDDTAVVSVMTANNELGAVNDVASLGAELRTRGVAFHTDAVQAMATLPVDATIADATAITAHKVGGPVGVGVAVLRRGTGIEPLLHGGGQDRGVRSGTQATALIAGCAAALRSAADDRALLVPRLRELTDRLWRGLSAELDGVRRNGPAEPERRLASHLHLSIDGVDGESLMFALDQAGVAASAGAACSSGAAAPSHVLAAADVPGDAALRLSLGWSSTEQEVEAAVATVSQVVSRLRQVGGGAVRSQPQVVG